MTRTSSAPMIFLDGRYRPGLKASKQTMTVFHHQGRTRGIMRPPLKTKPNVRRPTLADVAALANVGESTVDRVLNDRGSVRLETANLVLQTARQLGLKRILPPSHHTGLRIEVLLNRRELPLIKRMTEAFEHISSRIDHSIIIQRTILADDKAAHIAGRLKSTTSNAVIIYAPDDDLIVEAVNKLTATGVAVVTIISDLPTSNRLAYAGIDHYSAGETAGYFLNKMAKHPGQILILCHSFHVQSHRERVRGLTKQLEAENADLAVAEILEGQDSVARSERLLFDAMKRHPNIVGIYNVGAAHQAVSNTLRNVPKSFLPAYVGHELSEETRAMLSDGTMTLVIDQNPIQQVENAINTVLQHYGYLGDQNMPNKIPSLAFTLHGPFNI